MPVTIYKSTDANAPAKPSTGADTPKYIMDIFKACLVDGYSGKAAAGWTLDYNDTTAGKERMALSNGNGVIEFVQHRNNHIVMLLWDSITTPGVGAFYDDAFNDVMSDGVNGIKHLSKPTPGAESEDVPAIYTWNLFTGSQYDWTLYANDKAAWLRFHYPEGHASAEAGDSLGYSASYHPLLFLGAIQSPDLARDSFGNFFLAYGGYIKPNLTSGNTSATQHIAHMLGLRTPMGTVPDYAVNTPVFDIEYAQRGTYDHNPLSPVREVSRFTVTYMGADVPKPSHWSNTSQAEYHFAYLPGALTLGRDNGSNGGFWGNWSLENGFTWNQQTSVIGGLSVFPAGVLNSTSAGTGLTDDAGWWP
ncbi:hypothetical protein HCU74_08430 [Spongiibacter sp. KMU-166]|uniref:Uncharacterized protein n=1 Tax=Spongiibacter thalassae TaxID=2721624 RepID=A0ABX1GGD9_9GAMM|nr:hypothetical protein [Spongiibacter thalassae]NKI17442.1 hypothetical protein [Spongiibacter thalassae]